MLTEPERATHLEHSIYLSWWHNKIHSGRDMDNLSELPTTAQPSLLLLNEYCLLELFDFLKFKASMNLAETCVCLSAVANRAFRKYCMMKLDDQMTKNGKDSIYRFFSHFGHHVLSLIICPRREPVDWRIVKPCENLKRLKIRGISGDFENGTSLITIDNLEVLSFVECDSEFIKSFLNIVSKVKALSICWCHMKDNALMTLFRNCPEMESFQWWVNVIGNYRFDLNSLDIILNVEMLCLDLDVNSVSELDPLLKLNRLSKLKLGCHGQNITSFLSELAKKGIIQELELMHVVTDENFFEMLKSFESLQLLVLFRGYGSSIYFSELNASIVWPPKLKRFRFYFFTLTLDAFLSTIKQLKYLESICFHKCRIEEGANDNFNDVTELSQQILLSMDNCDRKQRLDVVLPRKLTFVDNSSKVFLLDSERLRIYNYTSDYVSPLDIRINVSEM